MSGSIKNVLYTADNGTSYGCKRDESNAEACGFTDVTSAVNIGIPRNIKPRYVNAQHPTNSAVKRRFEIGTLAYFNGLKAGTESITTKDPLAPTDDITWVITSFRGEVSSFYSGTDTGLNDGDAT